MRRVGWGRLEPWQRNQLVLVATVAAAFFGLEFSSSFVPLYVRYLGVSDLGEAALWSGLVVGVAPLCTAIMGPVWGALADRFGPKKLVIRALIVISVLSFSMGLAPNVGWVFVIRAAMGGLSGFTPMAMALAVSLGPRERVGQTVGLMQAAQIFPMAIGPPLGGLLSDAFGLRANFTVTAVVVALATLVLVFQFKEERAPASGSTRVEKRQAGRWGLLGLPGFGAVLLLLFLAQFVDRSLTPILPLYLAQINTPAAQLATISGLVVAAGAVAAATSATIYGRLARPGRTTGLLAIALGGGALCVGPLALVDRWEQVLVLRMLLSLVAGGSLAMAYTLGTRLVPPGQAGLTLGTLSTGAMLGSASAPFAAGGIGRFDLRGVFLIDAICCLLAVGLVLLLLRPLEAGRPASDSAREPADG